MDLLANTLNHLFLNRLVSSDPHNSDNSTMATSSDESITNSNVVESVGAFETMDRFLENDSNLLVQSLVSLESKTNISRRYLARAFLAIITGYFLFSNAVFNMLTHLFMYLYPSYRSYLLLKNPDLSKEDLIDILKYWIFIGLFSTLDCALGSLIPFSVVFKMFLIIQCVLPRRSSTVDFFYIHLVTPIFRYMEKNENIQQVNSYLQSLTTNLKFSTIEYHHED